MKAMNQANILGITKVEMQKALFLELSLALLKIDLMYYCAHACLYFSVNRFVKYTGYGNAAGLLAQRGLMCGGRGATNYSSESDSDTEEYEKYRDQ